MSDETPTEPTEPTQEDTAAELDEHQEATPEDDSGEDDEKAMNAEAAKWRRRLRESQSELKSVTEQLDAVQRQQAEALIAASGVKPQAVWAVTELAGVLDDDGSVSAEKVAEAVTAAREKFGIARPAKGSIVPGVGNQPAGNPRIDRWQEAFSPKR